MLKRFMLGATAFAIFTSTLVLPASAMSLPEIKQTKLSNGIPVYYIERHDLPIVSARLILKAGGVFDPAGKSGVSDFTADLLTKGTKKYTAEQLAESTEFVGGTIGGSAGSNTASIGLTFLKKDLDRGLDLFREIVQFPTFPQEEFDKLKSRALAGLESSLDDPDTISSIASTRMLYGDHPYGQTGSLAAIRAITREDVLRFHQKSYTPKAATLLLIGDITQADVQRFDRAIGDWQNEGTFSAEPGIVPRHRGKKVFLVDADVSQAYITIGNTSMTRKDPDVYRASLMSFLLGGGYLSRLYQDIRTKQGLAYSVRSSVAPGRYAGSALVQVQTKSASAVQAIESILKEWKRTRAEGFTATEMKAGKTAILGEFARGMESNGELLSDLADIAMNNLGLDYYQRYPRFLNAIDEKEVKRVANRCFDPENYVLVVVGKASELQKPLERFGEVTLLSKRSLIE
ncbi:MAG: M16 family metallopeptidase [Bacteroidota bacterium]